MKRALLVEDDICIAEIIRHVLESKGHLVFVANNGDDAIKIGAAQRTQPFDLLLCDLGIPGAGAGEVVRVVRNCHPGIRVVIMTGHPAEDVAHYGIPGKFCVLEKPFSIKRPAECITCLEEVQSCDNARKSPRFDARTSDDTSLGATEWGLRRRR